MSEMYLTVEQAAERLQLRPFTIREQLKRGHLRGIKRGHQWRIPESALMESFSISSVGKTENWTDAAEKMAGFYAASLLENDEFTAITNAPDEIVAEA